MHQGEEGISVCCPVSLCCSQDASAKVMQFLSDNHLTGTNPTVDVGRMSKMAGGSC